MRNRHKLYIAVYTFTSVVWFLFVLVWLRVVSPHQLVEMLPSLVDLVSAVILAFQQVPFPDVMSVCYTGVSL